MGAGKSSLVLRFVKGQFLDFQVLSLSLSRYVIMIHDSVYNELYVINFFD